MATLGLGSMVVQLDLDGADFIRNTGQARQALGQLPKEIDRTTASFHTNRTAARLASEGISEMAGISGHLVFGLERMTESALNAKGAFLLLGQTIAIIGGTLLVAGLVQAAQDYIKFGETVDQTIDRLKQEGEEQKKFADVRRTTIVSDLALKKDQAAADNELAGLRSRLAEDEVGQAMDVLKGKHEALNFFAIEERRRITETVPLERGRAAQLIELEQLISTRRIIAATEASAKIQEIQKAQLAKTQATYLEETQAFLAQIKTRLAAIDALRAATATALSRQPQLPKFGWTQGEPVSTGKDIFGLGGGSTFIPRQFEQIGLQSAGLLAGLAKVRELKGDMGTLAEALAQAGREGARADDIWQEMTLTEAGLLERSRALKEEFADTPGVLAALDRAMGQVEIGGFRLLVDEATRALAAMGKETSPAEMLAQLRDMLTTGIPAGVNASIPELQKLRLTLAELQAQVNQTTGSVIALAQNLAGAQAQAAAGTGTGGIQVFEEP